ncbi:MAG: UDP-glucose 4-epimerase GalE [Planctomycetes bacterium]|nr:UDP-glucose 4-epimerase GalE [Planctomycetota bacterium]
MTKILVTGAAGYIGSHTVRCLIKNGLEVVAVDDLSEGHRAAVQPGVPLEIVNLLDEPALRACFARHRPNAVMHFAANCLVGESVANPGKYYRNNLEASLVLLRTARAWDCNKMIFSSTAATYGEPLHTPIDEEHPRNPINPYGSTKLMFEQALADHTTAHGFEWIALRYFNAAGAAEGGHLGEDHEPESHLIPIILQAALGRRASIAVFGSDYPTSDGTCVRDYIHVDDLADAHLRALEHLGRGGKGGSFNLGTGDGYTVRQVIDLARKLTKLPVEETSAARRPGDPAVLIADGTKARKILGWKPTRSDLETIIASAWKWHQAHPNGYNDRSAERRHS